ncbi:hypothetical protein MAR_027585 [Mya arenaria]|uniref:Uncharacterized protein n=1 Tax=Mya arenaria TaxID=6604 RepID=A0ABY7EVT3_MYAAR|nr:hypothetical protein MAR_027585 [Mya arenaria]
MSTLAIVGLLFVACRELVTINRSNRPEGSFKLLIASSILASLVSDLTIQTNLLHSLASGLSLMIKDIDIITYHVSGV